MAMGHEDRAILSFFRKDHDLHTHTTRDDHDLTTSPSHADISATMDSDQPILQPNAFAAMLEHDPNATRRKRRKTDKVKSEAAPNGSIAAYVGSRHAHPPQDENLGAETSETAEELPSTEDPIQRQSDPPAGDLPPGTQSPKRKIVKLNANGKLLSSPRAKQVDDRPSRRSSRRGKAGADKSKVVVVHYARDDASRERLGNLVEDIINGRHKHAASVPAPPPVKREQPPQPAKATHPFFTKKPPRKSDTVDSQPITLDSPTPNTATHAPIPNTSTPAPERPRLKTACSSSDTTRLLSSFKPRPKFPDPIHALWPPRDLTHVRGSQADTGQATELRPPFVLDQMKSKMAAVSIPDHESVLSSHMDGPSRDGGQVLRRPERYVTCGPVLQQAVSQQLSAVPNKTSHPAITALYSSLLTSLSPFDLGECDNHQWAQKHAPQSAEQVLQVTREVSMLRDWLKYLMISAVDTGSKEKKIDRKEEKKQKKRKKSEKLDGFVVSSGDEASEMDEVTDSDDELAGDVTVDSKKTVMRAGDLRQSSRTGSEKSRVSNAILLSGPTGCGKTASVYAVAKELDFEVFELNPGNRRSARDIVERVGDMTRNHLVRHMNSDNEKPGAESPSEEPAPEDGTQNKLMGFFKPTSHKKNKKAKQENVETNSKRSNQKQSLILIEEADLLFDEDRQFWSGVLTLINQSKRPIIMTCNDESLIPLDDITLHAILRYRSPPQALAVDYLILLAAVEGHLITRNAIEYLFAITGRDLRRSIMELNFWCQMAVGSEKSGLDWIIVRWPRGLDVDDQGRTLRAISLNTYKRFMGCFSRDMLMDECLEAEIEIQQETHNWWRLSVQDSESMEDSKDVGLSQATTNIEAAASASRLEGLRSLSDLADMRSALDILGSDCPHDPKMDVIDTSIPPVSEKQKLNYVEGYPLLDTELIPYYSTLPTSIGSTFEVLLGKVFRPHIQQTTETFQAAKVLAALNKPMSTYRPQSGFPAAFGPIMRGHYAMTGRLSPSFENGINVITEDMAPYIRAIMAFDLRLERYRLQLSGLLSQNGSGTTTKVRKTRASRAALEGGTKSETRKERWFPSDTNPALVLATGGTGWQDLLVQSGHFAVASPPSIAPCSSGAPVESEQAEGSSSEGGI